MINQISLIQLQYILALAEHKHFKKAAEACHVTQPTLSMQLQKLEEQLGLILFDRKSAPIVPTPAGQLVVQQARHILEEVDKLHQVVENQKDEISGSFKLGVLPTIAPYLLPRIVPEMASQLPMINLQAFDKTTDQIVKDLHSGQLDLGLMVTPFDDPALELIPVYREEFVLYISHRHKLFNQQVIDQDDLDPNEIWVLEEGHCFGEQVLNICGRKDDANKKFSYKSGSLEALKRLVDKYGGMTLLPELAVEDFDANSMKHVRKINAPYPVREVSIAVHKNFHKMALVKKLASLIKDALPFNFQEKSETKLITY